MGPLFKLITSSSYDRYGCRHFLATDQGAEMIEPANSK